MQGFGAGRTYRNPADSPLDRGNIGGWKLDWIGLAGGSDSEPAIANGFVYVGAEDGNLYAFAKRPGASCVGTPRTCGPVWTARTGNSLRTSPAVANGVVYVGASDGLLYAFDAAGVRGCGGSPKVCSPLWTAATGAASSPVVAHGNVYVNTSFGLAAYDATGTVGCTGVPKVCQPLWYGTHGAFTAAVGGNVVYVTNSFELYGYTASGCGGAPGTTQRCDPVWMGKPWCSSPGTCQVGEPAYENDRLYVSTLGGTYRGGLAVFDVSSGLGCSISCRPIWESDASWASPALALADDLVWQVQRSDTGEYGELMGYNTTVPCAQPCLASPERHADVGKPSSNIAISDGLVFVGNADGKLMAFDGWADISCHPTTNLCRPIWSAQVDAEIQRVVVSDGTLYATTRSGRIYAYTW